jgi:hypothetical protein
LHYVIMTRLNIAQKPFATLSENLWLGLSLLQN